MPPGLVLATGNPGKIREFRALLGGLGYEVQTLLDHPNVTLPPEGAVSYAENARGKAWAAAAGTGLLAVGDDSGLEVLALGGRPGIESARYGGPGLTEAERVERLLAALAGVTLRAARFRCILALVAPWGETVLVEGVTDGVLTEAPRGAAGFGYDPIFLVPALGRTLAELSPPEKHGVSHRGRAVAAARPPLTRWVRR